LRIDSRPRYGALVVLDSLQRETHTDAQASEQPRCVDVDDRAAQLLFDRLRLGMVLVSSGIAVVFIGAFVVPSGANPFVKTWQAVNFVIVAIAWFAISDPAERNRNLAIGITAYAVTIIATGAVGIAAGDATTPVILLLGLAVVSATLIPWHPWWQGLSVALIGLTDIWTVASVVPTPRLFWLQNVGAIAPTLAATVVISRVLHRHRAALAEAERERVLREERLREANRRLEDEIHQHQRTENALRFAMRELDHRVKNTLAIVESVAEHTLRRAGSLDEFRAAFTGRLQAMARIHTALAARRWGGLPVGELCELVVGPYRRDSESITIDADRASFLSSELARVLGMSLHELATNAAKYGALSVGAGRVAIAARIEPSAPSALHITWHERNGPPVIGPVRRGFGMQLIEDALAYQADGAVRLDLNPDGVQCDIHIPLPGRTV
jgi:two-component sensor histidine kinase